MRSGCERALLLFFCAAALLAAPAGAGDAGEWRPFESEEGRFRAHLPGTPATERVERETWLGRMLDVRHVVERPDAVYEVEHHELPAAARWFVPAGTILSRAKAGLLEDAGGREVSDREVERAGHPARRVTYALEARSGWSEEALLVLVGSRLYVLIAGGAPPDPERFFASFEFWE